MTDAEFREGLALAEAKRARMELEHVKRALTAATERADAAEWQLAKTTQDQLDCEATNAEINAENDGLRENVRTLAESVKLLAGGGEARIAELEAEVERMRPVVEAAGRWYDAGPVNAGIAAAVRGYRGIPEPQPAEVFGEHEHIGEHDCERCGEGVQHYLHTNRDTSHDDQGDDDSDGGGS